MGRFWLIPLLALAAGSALAPAKGPPPTVAAVKEAVQPGIDRDLADAQVAAFKGLSLGKDAPARLKLPVRVEAISDPWAAMTALERSGLVLAAEAPRLTPLLDALNDLRGKLEPRRDEPKLDDRNTLDGHIDYQTTLLDQAKRLRDAAINRLSADERNLLFARPTELVHKFGPQLPLTDKTRAILDADRTFCTAADGRIDWRDLSTSADMLFAFHSASYLKSLGAVLTAAKPIPQRVEGVTGDLLLVKETPHGLILFGGKGPNTYDLKVPVALLADLGGDDTYKGTLASSFDADHPNGVLIDFDGNDTYECGELGLATGRLGVGLLIDLAGDDTYKLAPGSGGAGFAGIGFLVDADGKDKYEGSRFTQGVAVAGVGLLLDLRGDDRYTSHGYAIGLGGPGGVGAVIDRFGNDRYQCGKKYASGYNQTDAPNAKPDDPAFQFDAFGLGIGLGRRTYPFGAEADAYNLAGGVGILIDCAGDDETDGSNFSQACGYFFGVGLRLDLAGDDVHGAARYGHASGAHYGMGLFIDYAGKDAYRTTGPTYNCGCAWDRSAFLFIDAAGDDRYELERSGGLGRADHGSWGVAADLGGRDRYRYGFKPAMALDKSLAAFLDAAGDDDYPPPQGEGLRPGNGVTHADPAGGWFADR